LSLVEESNEEFSSRGSVDSGTNKPINLKAHHQQYLENEEDDEAD